MLETLTSDRKPDAPEIAPSLLDSGTSDLIAPVVPLTEAQARADFTEMQRAGEQPTVREIAASWGWSKSAAGRLIAKMKAEQQLEAAERPYPATPAREAAISAADEARRQIEEARQQREREREAALDRRDEMFSASSPELLVTNQPATVVYWNPYDQVVILQREDLDENGDVQDPFVLISREHVPKLIARLQALLREAP